MYAVSRVAVQQHHARLRLVVGYVEIIDVVLLVTVLRTCGDCLEVSRVRSIQSHRDISRIDGRDTQRTGRKSVSLRPGHECDSPAASK